MIPRLGGRGLRFALSLLLMAGGASAQQAAPTGSEPYDRGWHIVRPGETLHSITAKYLGDALQWRQNWRLNPTIEDPDVLAPGQRIQVLVARRVAVPTALLRTVAGPVEERPAPIAWNPALEQDLLLEEDGLRTGIRGSTEIAFQDGTSVTLTEESLVFLRRAGRRLIGVPPRAVEIVEGQAELAASLPPGATTDIQILVGGTLARPQVDEAGVSQTRARRAADGAKVMVYEGAGEVEAGGAKVAVGRGMGTAVAEGQAPSPPEKLLPAPTLVSPPAGARLDFVNVELAWQPVEGAASYTYELCLDPQCARLVDRAVGLTVAAHRPPLRRGDYFWRITAVSASGLDGYPSAGTPLGILGDGTDRTPPTGSLSVVGRQLHVDERLYVDESVRIEPALEDHQSGVAGWRPVINGEEVDRARWQGSWPDGGYSATVVAVDRAGNEGRLPPVEFLVDALPPDLAGDGGSGLAVDDRLPPRLRRRWLRRGPAWLEVSVDGGRWLPLVETGSRLARALERRRVPWLDRRQPLVVRGDAPQLLVRSADAAPLALPLPGAAPVSVVRVWAVDVGVGVAQLELALEFDEQGGVAATASAVDDLGHRRVLGWRLRP